MAAPGASDTFIVVTGGDPVDPALLHRVPVGRPVIAVDSGIEHAQALGLDIDIAVGDFDSVSAAALERAAEAGALIERHPAAKDATDLELALDVASARGATTVHVLGGHGGRLDHLLANASLLAAGTYAHIDVVAYMGDARVAVVHRSVTLRGTPGETVSLLAVHGAARAVTTEGLLYPLRGEDLEAGSTRGVSNEMVADQATVRIAGGVLLAVQPGHMGTHHLGPTRAATTQTHERKQAP